MDNTPDNVPFNTLSDTYQIWVPIEDTELNKSIEVDENGDYIVQGVMTSDDTDEEDDSISPDGMDCSYFLNKGWIKYEHGNNPNQFIGEPLEVKAGQFSHPKTKKSVNGIFVKGRLFAQRELTKSAVRAIEDLQKSNTKRCMGWSIEGNVKDRDRKTGKIVKSVLRNVVLTMNPINTVTWAELAKSFAKNHEMEVNMEPMDKSMDIETAAAITPQSLEGAPKKKPKDKQQEFIDIFRSFCRGHFLQKSLRDGFINGTEGENGMLAYVFAKDAGLDYDDAVEFASYIAERHTVLKSLFGTNLGGDKMAKSMENMANLLDADLDELRKSMELEAEDQMDEEADELLKSYGDDEESDDDDSEDDNDDSSDDDDEYEDDGDSEDEDDDSEDDSEDEDDKKTEKSLKTDFAKSFAGQEENEQALQLDVSGFLQNLVDEVGFQMDGFAKSMSHVTKQQNAVVGALTSVGELVKSLAGKLDEVSSENAELRKSLNDVLERPVGRKSVVNQREVQTLTKSVEKPEGQALSRGQIMDVLEKSFEAGEIDGREVIRFNSGVSLDALKLPASVKTKVGLQA